MRSPIRPNTRRSGRKTTWGPSPASARRPRDGAPPARRGAAPRHRRNPARAGSDAPDRGPPERLDVLDRLASIQSARRACSSRLVPWLLVRLASRSELQVPGRPASVLLHFPLLMATLDPISTRVFAFLLRVPRIVSPRLSRSPRIVPIVSAILPVL